MTMTPVTSSGVCAERPADNDGVASVPDVQLLEWTVAVDNQHVSQRRKESYDVRTWRAEQPGRPRRRHESQKWQSQAWRMLVVVPSSKLLDGATHSLRASAAAVDERGDGVGVVLEIDGQGLVGEQIAVVGDEVLEVGRNLLRVGRGHASSAKNASSEEGRSSHDGA